MALPPSDTIARARRSLLVYFAALIAGSATLETLLLRTHEPIGDHQGLVFALMWVPALASLVARLACGEGFADVSFRLGGRAGLRAIAVAVAYPLAVGTLAYGVAWAAGLAALTPETTISRLLLRVVVALSLNLAIGSVFAAGEEIGWRGFMLTRLFAARVPRPVLVSGLAWGAWHTPLIVTGQYAAGPIPALSAVTFVADIVAASYLFAYLRMKTGSVWPAAIAHAAWNAIIQGVFDRSTQAPGIWVGESGILVVIADLVVVALLVRGPWTVRFHPKDEERPLVSALSV